MGRNTIEVSIDGADVVLDVDYDTSITDLDTDMDQVASKIAWYGRVLAAAEESALRVDTLYRQWRAVMTNNALGKGNLSEFKIKAVIEADPKFVLFKNQIGSSEALVTRLQKALIALQVKANILPSRGAKARDELRATGMSTPSLDRAVDAELERDTVRRGRAPPKQEVERKLSETFSGRDRPSSVRKRRPKSAENEED